MPEIEQLCTIQCLLFETIIHEQSNNFYLKFKSYVFKTNIENLTQTKPVRNV